MRDGIDNSGRVVWELQGDHEDVIAEETLDPTISGPSDADSLERIVDGDIELTIGWDAP